VGLKATSDDIIRYSQYLNDEQKLALILLLVLQGRELSEAAIEDVDTNIKVLGTSLREMLEVKDMGVQ
jgi:hypothetical protein